MKFPAIQGMEYKAIEEHVAESKWQFCNCQTCQEKRCRVERASPGTPFKFETYRRSDEKY
jgi:hypothetical protein